MRLKIHRGTKQIGGNIVEIATETTKIILDCGMNLPPLDESFSKDTIQIDGLTVGESAYDAVFITHYHADHCGLVERVNADIPIYMSNDTKIVLEIISDFIDSPLPRISHILEPGKEVTVGDIKVLPLTVGHSARGAMMFLVEAGGKKLLYTGDFNHIDDAYYPLIGKVDGMLCEGTNIGVRGGITERDIEREAARIMRETKGQVFVLCSTTNIERIRRIERACRISGRTLALDPFAKAILDRIERLLVVEPVGFVPHFISEEKTPRSHKYLAGDIQSFSGMKAVARMTNLTFLVRQSMGKFLTLLDKQTPLYGSTLIYSMWCGYETTAPTKKFLDLCRSLGMRIEYLHTSGHAYRELLETAVLQLNPDVIIPIHTESAEMFREIHGNVVLMDDGETLEICNQKTDGLQYGYLQLPEFDWFAKFSKVHIIKLLSEVENRIWSLALKGASDRVAERFFNLMESVQEEEIRADSKLLCNVRRKDVEEAQRYILERAKTKGEETDHGDA